MIITQKVNRVCLTIHVYKGIKIQGKIPILYLLKLSYT